MARYYGLRSLSYDLKYKMCGTRYEIEETRTQLVEIRNHVTLLRAKETRTHEHIIEGLNVEIELEKMKNELAQSENLIKYLDSSVQKSDLELDAIKNDFERKTNLLEHVKVLTTVEMSFNCTKIDLHQIQIKLSDLESSVNNIERHLRAE